MWKIYLSRWLNWYLFQGDPMEMFSSRVHRERWWCEKMVDLLFFWHHKHCEKCYRYEQRERYRRKHGS